MAVSDMEPSSVILKVLYMKPPIFKALAFGKKVTAEIHVQEMTQKETRIEGQ